MSGINITWDIKDKGSSYRVIDAHSPDAKSCVATFDNIITSLGQTMSESENTPQYHHEELPLEDDHVEA